MEQELLPKPEDDRERSTEILKLFMRQGVEQTLSFMMPRLTEPEIRQALLDKALQGVRDTIPTALEDFQTNS